MILCIFLLDSRQGECIGKFGEGLLFYLRGFCRSFCCFFQGQWGIFKFFFEFFRIDCIVFYVFIFGVSMWILYCCWQECFVFVLVQVVYEFKGLDVIVFGVEVEQVYLVVNEFDVGWVQLFFVQGVVVVVLFVQVVMGEEFGEQGYQQV